MLNLRRLAALALLGLAALSGQGCLSPTLPLPPPESPDLIQSVAGGAWLIAGSCDKHALVMVLNVRTGDGVIRTCEDGSYAATLQGKECDLASVSEESHDETSPPTEFQLEPVNEGTPSGNACQ